jgi:hypothetical protein
VARDKELFHMLVKALMNGSAMHILQVLQAAGTESGSTAWTSIITWYGSAATSRTIIDHYRAKLESLKLDQNTTASEYVNVFIICLQKLESKQEGYTPATKRQRFLDQIVDKDCDVVKHNLQGDPTQDFNTTVTRIRQREQELEVQGNKEQKAKYRRFKQQNDKSSKSGDDKFDGKIPEIPSHVLFKVEAINVCRDLMK